MYLLNDLWYGNVNPSERYAQRGSKYRKLSDEVTECEEKLLSQLSPECAESLEEFLEKHVLLTSLAEADTFIQGVRIGAQFVLDVTGDYRSPLSRSDEN